jgi:uncharacterized SAM-binding protein YcdF (DUF218 family)
MYHFLVTLSQPHTILSLLMCWAVFRLWRRRGEPHRPVRVLVISLVILAILSMPAVAHLTLLSLERYASPLAERPTDAEAIVVFSAGLYPPSGPRLEAEMDEDSLHRCLYAAKLYAQGSPCPILVSGGKVDPDAQGPTCAAVMSAFLHQYGVSASDIIVEENSGTTYENAVECARILKERQIRRVVLVVDAVDMYRAAACLRKQGIEVIPAPCHYRATVFQFSGRAFVPRPGAAVQFQRVWHEWLGSAWYWCRGRI